MSDRISISAHEHGVVRVFAVDDKAGTPSADDALRDALGAEHLETRQIELFDLSDLGEMRLSDYLSEGHGIPAAQMADMRGRLDGLSGRVMIVPSRAFGGQAQQIAPRAPLRLVGRFTEEETPVQFDPLPSASAQGSLSPTGGGNAGGPRRALWMALAGLLIAATVAVVLALAL